MIEEGRRRGKGETERREGGSYKSKGIDQDLRVDIGISGRTS